MTAPISNEPTTTRLHHYAGHYSAAHWGRVWVLQARRPGGLKPLSPFLACACVRLKPASPLLACACVGLKPPSPLRAPAEPRLKPSSPLRVRNGCFWRVFRAQRCRRFQRSLVGGEQWCCWFQRRHVVAPIGPVHRSCRRRGARGGLRWGFCSIRSWLAACRRRVVPLMTPFPPFGDDPAEPPPGGNVRN